MKIPNKRELQQIALNHSSDIDFEDFIKTYRRCTAELYSFLVNDTALSSDDPLRFRKNSRIKLEMKNYNMILIERLQKYQVYHPVESMSMNILLVKKYCLRINSK